MWSVARPLNGSPEAPSDVTVSDSVPTRENVTSVLFDEITTLSQRIRAVSEREHYDADVGAAMKTGEDGHAPTI